MLVATMLQLNLSRAYPSNGAASLLHTDELGSMISLQHSTVGTKILRYFVCRARSSTSQSCSSGIA